MRPPAPPAKPQLDVPSGQALLVDRLRSFLSPDHVDLGHPPYIRCRPASAADIAEIFTVARVGGVRVSCGGAPEALLHLSLSRMNHVVHIDDISLTCEAQAGVTLLGVERALRARQLSLGPLPARSLSRTLGAALSAPRPAEAAPERGRLRDRVLRLEAVLPERREMTLPVALSPRRATGPDLKQVLIGSRGRAGVIATATLQVARVAQASGCAGWMFAEGRGAIGVLHEVLGLHGGIGPTDVQVLSRDLLERAARQAPAPPPSVPPGEAALLLRSDGLPGVVEATLAGCAGLCAAAEAVALPEALCTFWLAPDVPDIRDVPEAGPESGAGLVQAALFPPHERGLPPSSPDELHAIFAGAPGPRVLCGVHLNGAALVSEASQGRHAPAGADGGGLFERLLRELDPQQILI